MERKLYRLGPDDLPIHDHGPVLENDKALHVERAQEIIDHYQHFQDPDREGRKSAENIYDYLVKSVREVFEVYNKEIAPHGLALLFENAKLAEVNPWDYGAHLRFTLEDMLDTGKGRVEKHEKSGITPDRNDYLDYSYVLKTNQLLQRAIELEKKTKGDAK